MSRTLVDRYWKAQEPYNPGTLAELRHREWFADWPQSAERIPTHDADVAIHTSYPGYPEHRLERVAGSDETWRVLNAAIMFLPVRISGASDLWFAEFRLEYPDDGPWYAVAIIELRDGLVGSETAYYCRQLDAAPWPASYPERAPVPPHAISASMEHQAAAERHHRTAYDSYVSLATSDPVAAASMLFHDAAVADRPQLGQRVSGLAGITRVHEEQRSVLPGRVRRVVASGDFLLSESHVSHESVPWFVVTAYEFEGDKVARATEYLAQAYEAPEWRRAWTQPLAPGT